LVIGQRYRGTTPTKAIGVIPVHNANLFLFIETESDDEVEVEVVESDEESGEESGEEEAFESEGIRLVKDVMVNSANNAKGGLAAAAA
jgi:hypothetical protein